MSQTESGLEDQDKQMTSEHSRNQRVQQQDKSAAVHRCLSDSAAEREGEHVRLMNRGEGHLSQAGRNKHLSPPRTGTDIGHSIKTDEVNYSAHIKELAADKSNNGNKSAEGEDSSMLAIDKEAFLTKSICGEGRPEAEEGLNPGGGASMLFRKDGAKQPTMASTQHTMVCYTAKLFPFSPLFGFPDSFYSTEESFASLQFIMCSGGFHYYIKKENHTAIP